MSVIVEITQGGSTSSVTVSSVAADKAAAAASAVLASTKADEAAASATEALAASNVFTINIENKGNNDAITHNYSSNLRVLTFYNSDDGNRQMNSFFADNITTGGFTLKNDFSNDKFNGTLICVKY